MTTWDLIYERSPKHPIVGRSSFQSHTTADAFTSRTTPVATQTIKRIYFLSLSLLNGESQQTKHNRLDVSLLLVLYGRLEKLGSPNHSNQSISHFAKHITKTEPIKIRRCRLPESVKFYFHFQTYDDLYHHNTNSHDHFPRNPGQAKCGDFQCSY